ncbi:MAG TPA: hypothetical protein PLS53_07905 [Thermoanaerobaculaceae bacterium]|nr:hypothetical protein [Thermoanaerobaculaceae bacterium]HPS78061.1 hypothetical protein [Thermoanaerobaculaceae bacterium]
MLHLLAITAGLLIALALEGSVERLHHRHLVRSARETIALEIQANQQTVARELSALPTEERQLNEILAMISDVQYGRTSKPLAPPTWLVARLDESAWSTAFSTGAFAYMDYAEVKRYSRLYAMQQLYNTTGARSLESRGQMYAFLVRLGLPDKPSDAEFEQGKQTITTQLVMDKFLAEMGGQLNTTYAPFRALQASPEAK